MLVVVDGEAGAGGAVKGRQTFFKFLPAHKKLKKVAKHPFTSARKRPKITGYRISVIFARAKIFDLMELNTYILCNCCNQKRKLEK